MFKTIYIWKGMGLSFQESRNWLLDCPFYCSLGRAGRELCLTPRTQDVVTTRALRRPP